MIKPTILVTLKNLLRPILAGALLIDASVFIAGLLLQSHPFLNPGGVTPRLTALTIAHIIFWTIGPPAWFFVETYTLDAHLLPSEKHTTDPVLKAKYDRLRLSHDLASKVWLAVLAAIVFFIPKS